MTPNEPIMSRDEHDDRTSGGVPVTDELVQRLWRRKPPLATTWALFVGAADGGRWAPARPTSSPYDSTPTCEPR